MKFKCNYCRISAFSRSFSLSISVHLSFHELMHYTVHVIKIDVLLPDKALNICPSFLCCPFAIVITCWTEAFAQKQPNNTYTCPRTHRNNHQTPPTHTHTRWHRPTHACKDERKKKNISKVSLPWPPVLGNRTMCQIDDRHILLKWPSKRKRACCCKNIHWMEPLVGRWSRWPVSPFPLEFVLGITCSFAQLSFLFLPPYFLYFPPLTHPFLSFPFLPSASSIF